LGQFIQNIFEQHIGRACNQLTTKKNILGITHIHRELLMWKYKTYNTGNSSTCAMNCNYKIAATIHSLKTWFVSVVYL